MQIDFIIDVKELHSGFIMSPLQLPKAKSTDAPMYCVSFALKEIPETMRDRFYFDNKDMDAWITASNRERPNLITMRHNKSIHSSYENVGTPPLHSIIGLLAEYSMHRVEKALIHVPCKVAVMARRSQHPVYKKDYTHLILRALAYDYETLHKKVKEFEDNFFTDRSGW